MSNTDSEVIVDYYTDFAEESRLNSPWGQLEYQRTLAILKSFLPPAPAKVLDVGGAAGVYALRLAHDRYDVHLIDPVAKHVEQAKAASAKSKTSLSAITMGDARKLDIADSSVDAVLMLGPLYHLTERADRIRAISEAHRVLKPGGVFFAAGISRFASVLDGLSRRLLDDPAFCEIVEQDLKDGQHRNPTDNPEYFTTAYLHSVDDLRSELGEGGFEAASIHAIEGPGWLMSSIPDWMENEDRRGHFLKMLDRISEEESLLGVSSHLMGVATKTAAADGPQINCGTCIIRNWRIEDIESLVENANDAQIAANLRDRFPHPYTANDARQWIRIANRARPCRNLAIVVDGKAAGGIGIELGNDVNHQSAEIGYWLGTRYWGRGIATEALTAMTKYAFDEFHLNRIFAVVFEGNEPSARVLQKAGFEYEGRMRKAAVKNGQVLDELMYAQVRA